MYFERNIVSGNYGTKDFDDSDDDEGKPENVTVWVISRDVNLVKPYTYDEAISLAGHGPYSVGLLRVCCLCLLAASLDMSSFATIIDNSACDLRIGPWERQVLLTMPFLGAIGTAFAWGFVCDTRGRKPCLLVAMWGSFTASSLSAFSPNWVALAVLKLISVGFCSCAPSITFTMIGECCPVRVKTTYFYILMSVVHPAMAIYTALGYLSIKQSFAINLGLLTFTSWRLFILVLALPLGISAMSLHFIHESPKFLANAGMNRRALEILKNIWMRNNCVGKKYPVEKLIFEEEGNIKSGKLPQLQSLWEHTKPLFKRPLLFRTLQLYFLSFILHSTASVFFTWIPCMSDTMTRGIMPTPRMLESMCKIIEHSHNSTDTGGSVTCLPKLTITDVWTSVAQGLILIIVNISIIAVRNRKLLVIIMLMIIALSSAGCVLFESIISIPLFFIISSSAIITGIIFSYFVDLYPTSLRGMAGCLSMVVASSGSFLGSNVATLATSHCTLIFSVITLSVLCGVLVACLLPSDRPK